MSQMNADTKPLNQSEVLFRSCLYLRPLRDLRFNSERFDPTQTRLHPFALFAFFAVKPVWDLRAGEATAAF
jgi:hypothetical protein